MNSPNAWKGRAMEKLKVGLVGVHRGTGYGHIFNNYHRTEVAAVCDINEARMKEVARELKVKESSAYTNYDAFIDDADIDVVFIGTPMPFHVEEATKALDRNKHVLSEVTAATSINECEEL